MRATQGSDVVNYGLNHASGALVARLTSVIQQHPKRVTAALAAILLTGGGGAFAVANLGPDPADLPVRMLSTPVESLAEGQTLAELTDSVQGMSLYRSEYTRGSDTAETLLQRLGVADPAAAAFMRGNDQVRQHVLGRAGRLVTAETTPDHQLSLLTVRWAPDEDGSFRRLVVERKNNELSTRIETGKLTASPRLAGGIIRSSLFAATDAASIPDAVAMQMADIFQGDVDFRRGLRKGDRFSVVYESLEADGEPLRAGRVLSAEFHNNGKVVQALWFQDEGKAKGDYYTMDGKSRRQAYLTSPVEFSRISSGFAMRMHPIHKTWRAHLGTDFAAPTGTKVRTVGDGTVSFAGVQNGYGNVIFVDHANNHTTVYAHLSHIGVTRGQRVEQGDIIGNVGSTGWATGPHLHFEFRVNGEHRDPMTIVQATDAARPVSKAGRAAFDKMAAQMRIELQASNEALALATER
ncbi:M23 family metallopeptidase [Delftia tsuruhatensis]|uniref:peptidoglycan DD-metalloendopeptidase family protein n=1 Tax=Delftia tsuruhatensis TaxID=180282 RepID=UPI0024450497|nr:peptidoglycan DD-metalloendopeptidase family protein [Delftia tsuruhatensis]MDH0775062.1 M23 family metallopeptidase [Delftia tsuruhatensis]MDH1459024.1 M23 family metallopeptidase [Delftia tsuruhatensis]MDH1824486.1 M23 family metallopeptidase [Delftia tsuruhatensis]WGG11726.1 M23 family metallopeptidase [Delftia tsuruhatensis]